MKEKRVTKKAIFASLLSVAVCTSMLIGTSYAWFTDSVTSAGNKIKSGTLNIDLQVKKTVEGEDEAKYVSVKDDSAPIFTYQNWEPGYTSWTNVKVLTDGTLALKYTLRFVSDEDISSAKLAEAIDVYYAPSEITQPRTRPVDLTSEGLVKLGTLKEVFDGTVDSIDDTLIPGVDEDDAATIVLKMQESAGNEYQGLAIPDFDLQVIAMQLNYETDTFDKDYDKNANGIPDHPEWGGLNTKASAKAVAGEATVVEATGATLTMPADAVAADTAVAFEVKAGEMPDGITVGDNNTAMTYDITVTPNNEALKKVELNIGSGKTGLVVYHEAAAMTKVDADNTGAEGYFYNPATGILTIWSKTFSPFTIVTAKPSALALSDDKTEATAAVAEAIAAAESGDTVVLGAGEAELPATIPANVLIKGKEDGSTELDTVNVSGTNTGRLENIAVENVTFVSPTRTNPKDAGTPNEYEWDGIISHKTTLNNVTFTNCDFVSDWATERACNAIYGGNAEGEVVFDGCTISADVYGVNFSHVDGTLIFRNCDITGWNSFGGAKVAGGESKVIFENCTFHKSDYGTLRFYQNAEVKNCTFDADYGRIDVNADDCTVKFTGCTLDTNIIRNNIDSKTGEHDAVWIVDGVDISSSVVAD